MNLLTDSWLPVTDGTALRRVSLRDVLCTNVPYDAATPRDDFDAAVVTLAAALVQVLFPDLGDDELVAREEILLAPEEFARRASAHVDHYDLFHPRHPFMQTRGIESPEKPAGRLVPGTPGASSHLLGFRATSVPARLCVSCATLSLYVRATMAPSFGGGYCNPLRGVPIDFHVRGPHLRQSIWRNVLGDTSRRSLLGERPHAIDLPTWVSPIPDGLRMPSDRIGLVRGLLWQPAAVELLPDHSTGQCDVCGETAAQTVSRFRARTHKVIVDGTFPHPRGARVELVNEKTEESRVFFAYFSDASPVWTWMRGWVTSAADMRGAAMEPEVVAQFRRLWPKDRVVLTAVGYVSDKAKLVVRRSETIAFACRDWNEALAPALTAGRVRDAVSTSVFFLGQEFGVRKARANTIARDAAAEFSRAIDGAVVQAMAEGGDEGVRLLDELRRAAIETFQGAVGRLGGDGRASKEVTLGRIRLRAALKKLLGTSVEMEVESV